jgi:protein ImuA
MIAQLRQSLRALQKPAGIADGPGALPLGIVAIDATLGGGLTRGALHEIAAAGEAHVGAAAGFALGLAPSGTRLVWIAEDMALVESGAPYGPGLEAFGLRPENLLTVAAAHTRDLLWAMEEALRCRTVAAVIGELRHGAIDPVAVRRLSLAAAQSGALALLLRGSPPRDASTAATRWIVGAAPHDCFAVRLTRNRRGPLSAWMLQWSDDDERFVPATHAQPVAAPTADRPHRKVA